MKRVSARLLFAGLAEALLEFSIRDGDEKDAGAE
jgi:hypothetical protein